MHPLYRTRGTGRSRSSSEKEAPIEYSLTLKPYMYGTTFRNWNSIVGASENGFV